MSDESKKRVLLSIKSFAKKMKGDSLNSRLNPSHEMPSEDPAHEASESPEVENEEMKTGVEAAPSGADEGVGHESSESLQDEFVEPKDDMGEVAVKVSASPGGLSPAEKATLKELLSKLL